MKQLYIMISKTDTGVGKLIRLFSGYHYNHVSLTLDPSFRTWVSFARYHQDAPLYSGFVREPVERYLAKGEQIDIRIFALPLSQAQFETLSELFRLAGTKPEGLQYNLFSLLTAIVGLEVPISGAYTCLGFANRVLGTRHKYIQNLDAQLQEHLIYDGTMADLAPDSGRRDDPYFTRLGFRNAAARSLEAIGSLLCAAFVPKPDPVNTVLTREGVTL